MANIPDRIEVRATTGLGLPPYSSFEPFRHPTDVVIDHVAAAGMAIRHLYESSRRKIASMKGHRHVMDTDSRWEAMMEIATEFGVQPTPDRIVRMRTSAWSPEVAYELAKR